MKQAVGVVVVAVISVLNMYVALPVGYGFDLSPMVIFIAALVGSVGGTVAMVFLGDRILPRLRRAAQRVRPGSKEGEEAEATKSDSEGSGKARAIVERFGAPGLGLIGPSTIGGFASAISGVAMGIPKVRLAVWVGIGQALVVTVYSLAIDTAVA